MMQGKSGEQTRVTPQGIADTMASGHGGTPVGGRRGLSRKEVARKGPSPRASGAGSKQPTKRTSVKQKAKRAASAASKGIGARAATKDAGRKVARKPAGAAAARKAAATKNTAARRASKTGSTRKRVHVRH